MQAQECRVSDSELTQLGCRKGVPQALPRPRAQARLASTGAAVRTCPSTAPAAPTGLAGTSRRLERQRACAC
eukprot:3681822-Rhodomonas_salina.1